MGYERQTWNNGASGGTPITADALNHIEAGVKSSAKGFAVGSADVVPNSSTDLVTVEGSDPIEVYGSGDTLGIGIVDGGIGRSLFDEDVRKSLANADAAIAGTVPDGSLTAVKMAEHALLDLVSEPGTAYFSFEDSNPAKLFGGTWTVRVDTRLFMGLRIYRRVS